ncbi:MAG: hypothetical protein KJZ62_10535 [Fimbriimonadaceae bacterium]|nr:hypothetical protein [Fimbriimonadaceae bacterium]QOJ10786.1 MAG: hypothetical protein HRU74_01485 [Chthonomonadaceae bacterium]
MRILGCWYSTNAIHEKILRSSIATLDRAVDQSRIAEPTVRTCTWQLIPWSPFVGWEAHFRLGVHFGIVLQVLRIFYEEQSRGEEYDAVCFLEHDVLYPEDYFDRVANALLSNPDKVGVSHLDYIGLNHTGWLEVTSRHDPMHEISLRYEKALEHFENLCRECALRGAALLEPEDKSTLVRIPYLGERPSCHINHSRHFTTHYNCYAKDSGGQTEHPYWGDFENYYPKGEKSVNA